MKRMVKKIEDYLHLYLGRNVFDSFTMDGKKINNTIILSISNYEWILSCIKGGRHKLVLRQLSSMTDEEKVRLALWEFAYKEANLMPNDSDNDFFIFRNENGLRCHVNLHHFSAETTRKLLKAGFDIFRLIESGLAIDPTKTPTP